MPRVRHYIYVPYEQKEEAKSLGALWDNKERKFYIPSYIDKDVFAKWSIPQNQETNINIIEAQAQFSIALQQQGLLVEIPIMNGKLQRCQVEGDKVNEKSGAYIGHLDSYPAGYIENFKSGKKINWKFNNKSSKNYQNDFKNSSQYQDILLQKQEQKTKELESLQEKTAIRLQQEYQNAIQAPSDHPYLVKKNIQQIHSAIKIDRFNNLLIPLSDKNGKMWSLQRISPNGNKIIGVIKTNDEKLHNKVFSARKKGCFYTQTELEKHDEFYICEGFATAISVQDITGKPTIMAVDSGNLINICDELVSAYPNKQITIFSDNDLKKELLGKTNTGLESALKCQSKYPNIKIVKPQINQNDANKITDFNDSVKFLGKEKTKQDINFQI